MEIFNTTTRKIETLNFSLLYFDEPLDDIFCDIKGMNYNTDFDLWEADQETINFWRQGIDDKQIIDKLYQTARVCLTHDELQRLNRLLDRTGIYDDKFTFGEQRYILEHLNKFIYRE
jgi:hypothetical protein